jgi:uncharacterized protein (TIGR04255 family)
MKTQSQSSAVFPLASGHSVQNAVFVCEFTPLLTAEQLKQVESFYNGNSSLQEFLPIHQVQHGASFTINATDGHFDAKPTQGDVVGLTYMRMASNGVLEWQVNIERNRIVIVSGVYTRWANISSSAKSLLSQFLSVIANRNVTSIALQYIDAFEVHPESGKPVSSAIFDSSNRYLNSIVMNALEAWHSHSGWFETIESNAKVLNNLNVDVIPAAKQGFLKVALTHMQQAYFSSTIPTEALFSVADHIYEELHKRNKSLLSNLLTEEVRSLISLENTSGS